MSTLRRHQRDKEGWRDRERKEKTKQRGEKGNTMKKVNMEGALIFGGQNDRE